MFFSAIPGHTLARAVLAFAAVALPASAQVEVAGRSVEIHGFASQGFAYSNDNNYLTMPTSTGSFAFTDGGFNISTRLTSRLRIGGQAYIREIGDLGRGQIKLDWALGDYRISDAFGIRAGKIKTVLGLYNDTQDVESLHTWAIMPQSIYSLDLRETSLAHMGGDIYGRVTVPHLGNLAYTLYAGSIANDRTGGYVYTLRSIWLNPSKLAGVAGGADFKWNTPVSGLLLGVSYLESQVHTEGTNLAFGVPFTIKDFPDLHTVFSAQYTWRNLRLDSEYTRDLQETQETGISFGRQTPAENTTLDRRGWYVAGAYRLSKHLELGSYHSRFYPNADRVYSGPILMPAAGRHVFDQTITARVDFDSHWDLKLEEHFIDGYGDSSSASGFYLQQNPKGLKPKTDLFVLRAGFNF